MPILGVIASSTRQGQGPVDDGAMFPIFATTVTSTAASITFSNIPSTYTHLQLRTFSKTTNANANDAGGMNTIFNADATSSYSFHYLLGSGAGTSQLTSANSSSSSSFVMGFTNSNNYSASNFSGSLIDILDYKNTNKYKTVKAIGGNDGNGAGFIWVCSGLWQKTNALNSITITPWSGSFMQYSSFALYGLK
jgi:hypothetical protein